MADLEETLKYDASYAKSYKEKLLVVKDLKKYFSIERGMFKEVAGYNKAVDGISFEINKGEIMALVGESGCGKTTTARMIIGLLKPTDGRIYFHGRDMSTMSRKELAQRIQIVFQNPFASLNPKHPVGTIIGEAVRSKLAIDKKKPQKGYIEKRVKELLGMVGLPADAINEYPHQFSGGQRQRIGVARALAMEPELILADEPVSALDISVQAQILNLLLDLRDELGLSYLLIAHDLNVVHFLADRVAVMYKGKIAEMGPINEVYENPKHPYTKKLLNAVPKLELLDYDKR